MKFSEKLLIFKGLLISKFYLDYKKYQVVIIGAGPAGLRCAQFLTKKGKEVLEKNEKVVPKYVGELIFKSLRLLGLPQDLLERQFHQITVFIRNKKFSLISKYPLISIISREKLGEWMLEKTQQAEAFGQEIAHKIINPEYLA
ncbi:MAG: FAD-dependent monooxygenase [Patescibacteria group bacterium]|nr:FAD-dependent monooxygenase [Patescibacteria group bacterium]